MSFNHEGIYTCECGKTFTNSQSFNGHKCHCKTFYMKKYDSTEKYEQNKLIFVQNASNGQRKYAVQRLLKKQNEIEQWLKSEPKCESCGQIIKEKIGSGRFCSVSCTKRRKHSEETKQKISESLHKVSYNTKRPKQKDEMVYECKICKKILMHKPKTGLCQECLHGTPDGHKILSQNSKLAAQEILSSGRHKGWVPRNKKSFAEKICEDLLNQNQIQYSREKRIRHIKQDYSLDFYIETEKHKIDLEIDGKQHNYQDRIELDHIRDNFLSNLGYDIYRIKFKTLKTEVKKREFEEEIQKFINYLKTLDNNNKI